MRFTSSTPQVRLYLHIFQRAEYGHHEGETISLNEDSKKEVEKLVQQDIVALRPNPY